MTGVQTCALPISTPVISFIKHFRPEFEYYIAYGKSMIEQDSLQASGIDHTMVDEHPSVSKLSGAKVLSERIYAKDGSDKYGAEPNG